MLTELENNPAKPFMNYRLLPRKRDLPAWLRTMLWHMEACILYLFWLLSGLTEPSRASAAGRKLFAWIGPRLHKQQFVERNLSMAFPDLERAQRKQLARSVWGNFGSVLAEYPHLDKLSPCHTTPMIEIEIHDEVRRIIEQGKSAVYITAHLGNWELAAAAIVRAGVPLSVVYAPQGNPITDRMLQKKRQSLGCRFIAKQHALRGLVRELRSGRSVGILPDQRVDSGKPVPFFGHDALTTTSPAWLAVRVQCPLIPVQIARTGNARYRAILHKPLSMPGQAAGEQAIIQLTTSLNCLFEGWIRRHPEQWLCMRRRWPGSSVPHVDLH